MNYELKTDAEGLSHAVATLKLQKGGLIKWRFYTDKAPKTAARIAHLISTGFYDGIIFHRIVPGFVVQGGDPTGTGTGGSGEKLKAEFNDIKHEAGIVSMARAQSPDSADSQFFMMLGKHTHLDGAYTAFAKIVEGGELVTTIKQGDAIESFSIA
jgi:cyclophilin family peptidyl-prolyl cis-trans isomerase